MQKENVFFYTQKKDESITILWSDGTRNKTMYYMCSTTVNEFYSHLVYKKAFITGRIETLSSAAQSSCVQQLLYVFVALHKELNNILGEKYAMLLHV